MAPGWSKVGANQVCAGLACLHSFHLGVESDYQEVVMVDGEAWRKLSEKYAATAKAAV